ncbi:UDP-3-O-(3-hydroxymyristoyl)glucosamine N-acyltransferase [candidate division KSB1 bacterium]|nr:MAG: UDP-3-O-(3-hydroxymyristoyl)glucosamine N-acyltransferase [candidate division KSB1 bacterium]
MNRMKLAEIARWVNGRLIGDGNIEITGIAPIETAKAGELSFIANPRYKKFLQTTSASAVLVPEGNWDTTAALIFCRNPYLAFAQLMRAFFPKKHTIQPGVHPSAVLAEGVQMGEGCAVAPLVVIEKGCQLGQNVILYPGVYLGEGVEIGNEVVIYSNVSVLEGVKIGNRVIIHANSVIGSDGFGFVPHEGRYVKIPQAGTVVIEDDVEIGANCAIDRATLGETRICKGTKLDNLIQVAHNVQIGENTVIAAQTGISGSTKIGNNVTIGGQVGIAGHIIIGDRVVCGAQAGVTKSIPAGTVVSGYQARPHRQQLRIEAALQNLPKLIKKIAAMETQINKLEKQLQKNQNGD